MDRSTIVRTGVAGAIAGMGLAVGGVAMANADTPEASDPTTTSTTKPARPGGGQLAATLAKQLGLEESVVKKALDSVRDDLKPTEAERTARRAAFIKALAEELDVSEAKVKAALAVAQTEARATARANLATKLAAAVTAGTLTEADKASVLKAFDAKVIGGGGGPRGHGGPGGPGGAPPAA